MILFSFDLNLPYSFMIHTSPTFFW